MHEGDPAAYRDSAEYGTFASCVVSPGQGRDQISSLSVDTVGVLSGDVRLLPCTELGCDIALLQRSA